MRKTLRLTFVVLALMSGALADEPGPAPDVAPEVERVRRLARELEKMRGRAFTSDVEVERQSAEDFRKFVEREIDRELPPAEATARSKALQAFGLLPPGYDLRKGLLDLYVSQAGAYYNPATKKFYVLMARLPKEQMDGMIFHELMHALQDQHFDLATMIEKARKTESDDALSAVQHVIEGEAMFVMLAKQFLDRGLSPDRLPPNVADAMFQKIRDMDRKTMTSSAEMIETQLGPEAEEIRKAIAALDGVPNYLYWMLHAPYLKGQWTVYRARAATKKWESVDALFRAPPTTTEQVLHPEKATGDARDEPSPVPLSDVDAGPEWKLVRRNSLGELGTRLFLEERLGPEAAPAGPAALWPRAETRAEKAAAGWDGDRYAVYEGPGGELSVSWNTNWDTLEDAREFLDALAASGPKGARAPGEMIETYVLDEGEKMVRYRRVKPTETGAGER